VRGIVLKVRSIEEAGKYLKETSCFGRLVDGKIELDRGKTCGLLIQLTGESLESRT